MSYLCLSELVLLEGVSCQVSCPIVYRLLVRREDCAQEESEREIIQEAPHLLLKKTAGHARYTCRP